MIFLLLLPMAYLFWLVIQQQQRLLRHQRALELLCEALKLLQTNDLELLKAIRQSISQIDPWDGKTH